MQFTELLVQTENTINSIFSPETMTIISINEYPSGKGDAEYRFKKGVINIILNQPNSWMTIKISNLNSENAISIFEGKESEYFSCGLDKLISRLASI